MPISVVDLFCGVGGLTKGLELAGLDVVALRAMRLQNCSRKDIHASLWAVRPSESTATQKTYKKVVQTILSDVLANRPFGIRNIRPN